MSNQIKFLCLLLVLIVAFSAFAFAFAGVQTQALIFAPNGLEAAGSAGGQATQILAGECNSAGGCVFSVSPSS